MKNSFIVFANLVSKWSGKPVAFVLAVVLIVVWAVSGPYFEYSETWQLVVNTATTIITFLMVFVLQNTQNRDGKALQTKIDELILTSHAENKFIGAENLNEDDLRDLSSRLEKKAAEMNERADKLSKKRKEARAAAKKAKG